MSDYISRAFMKSLGAKCIAVRDEKTNELIAITGIDELPSADVQPVVRCKDCFKREICRTTRIWAVAPSDDWFCADGERLPLPEPLRGEKHETD